MTRVPLVDLPRYLLFNATSRSLLPVHVQPDLLLAIWNGHIPLRRGNDGRFPRSRGSELFGQIYLNRQRCPFDGHLHVFHDSGLSVMDRAWGRPIRIMVQSVSRAVEEV